MRWSQTLIPTLKETPADAVAPSHILLLRAGMIRQLGAGAYTYMPLGQRVLRKVVEIVRQENSEIGARVNRGRETPISVCGDELSTCA